ncbi:unnamed protein product [Rangifer tarandus platyrhynchus]|uniref:Uncharacterized protein n=1 Tax=Rangifer tarandus platyrhynchus TaxID=3082113 RepID=A0AC59YH75_RANTA
MGSSQLSFVESKPGAGHRERGETVLPSGGHVALPMSIFVPWRRASPHERLEDRVLVRCGARHRVNALRTGFWPVVSPPPWSQCRCSCQPPGCQTALCWVGVAVPLARRLLCPAPFCSTHPTLSS